MAACPVGFEDEGFDAGSCGRQVELRHSYRAVSKAISDDKEIVAAGFVEAHGPALPQTVARKALGVVADHAERPFDDLFRHRASDCFWSAVWCVESAEEEWFGWREGVFSGALREVSGECAV